MEIKTVEKAVDILKHVADQRRRWGKHYTDAGKWSIHQILEAVIVADDQGMFDSSAEELNRLQKELAKSNRQKGALNARYEKLKQEHATLKASADVS